MSKREDEYTLELKELESIVLPKYIQVREKIDKTSGYSRITEYNIQSLQSTINCRINGFAKIKEMSYLTAEDLLNVYCMELSKCKDDILYELLHDEDCLRYFEIFMRRYFLRNEKELSRNKPKQKMYELWFGDNSNCFGLMITPVFRNKVWENDKSEIRKVDFQYWSVKHILKTGLIDKEKNAIISFANIEELISFYKGAFYDKSKSKYEKAIMKKYFALLRQSSDYDKIAFLIPELRFKKEKWHKYRLDFTVLSAEKIKGNIGFELSPDSTHAYTPCIEQKNPAEIRKYEIQRWNNEMGKRNEYDQEFNISVRTFMEQELQDIDKCFEVMKDYICYKDDTKGSWEIFKRAMQGDLTKCK